MKFKVGDKVRMSEPYASFKEHKEYKDKIYTISKCIEGDDRYYKNSVYYTEEGACFEEFQIELVKETCDGGCNKDISLTTEILDKHYCQECLVGAYILNTQTLETLKQELNDKNEVIDALFKLVYELKNPKQTPNKKSKKS